MDDVSAKKTFSALKIFAYVTLALWLCAVCSCFVVGEVVGNAADTRRLAFSCCDGVCSSAVSVSSTEGNALVCVTYTFSVTAEEDMNVSESLVFDCISQSAANLVNVSVLRNGEECRYSYAKQGYSPFFGDGVVYNRCVALTATEIDYVVSIWFDEANSFLLDEVGGLTVSFARVNI